MIGIIGGTGIYEMAEYGRLERRESLITPYGKTPEISDRKSTRLNSSH